MPERPSAQAVRKAARRGLRVAVAAAAGFYPFLYALDLPSAALYALFSPIALGALSPLSGAGRDRSLVVLRSAPAALALTALGSVLAVDTLTAVAGMLVVGFALSFGSACGPRIAAVTPGLQLFYILSCFPPYAPGTLPQRLAGVAIGCLLLASCERVLSPEPGVPTYRERVAEGLDLAARAASALARPMAGGGPSNASLRRAADVLRLSRRGTDGRPTGAGRGDLALAQAGRATRRLLLQTADLGGRGEPPGRDGPSRTLLLAVDGCCADAAAGLRGRGGAADPGVLLETADDFFRVAEPARRPDTAALHRLLRGRTAVLLAAISAATASAAVAVAAGATRPVPGLPPGQFWYARRSVARLWAARLSGNLTPRSVVLQNAVRTALGLGAARMVAGALDLTHGFWVLLAVLTLARTTAVATWSAVRSAALGTLVGAVLAGLLLLGVGDATVVYAALLVPMMALAFTLGPLGGPGWAQGMFTVVVATAFAQFAPATWRLAEVRVVDVLAGSAIGLACGLLAWPAGARAEIGNVMSGLLRAAGPMIPLTAAAVCDGGQRARRLLEESARETRHRLHIAEDGYVQYRAEPPSPGDAREPDWLMTLNFAERTLLGAHWLPPRDEAAQGMPESARRWTERAAGRLAEATALAADFPPGGVRISPEPLPPGVAEEVPSTTLPHLVRLEVWLEHLAGDLASAVGGPGDDDAAARTSPDAPRPPAAGPR
ncbi:MULTISPECIES: FUSC family protein [unclassified Streptomyces]|uniref:FUSC family protein n=1 Tax=unclassified Streptomyces TaxID=2593676 RepID=UPI001904336B|nr:FUSC family protein [Streptomyces sp. HSG2]